MSDAGSIAPRRRMRVAPWFDDLRVGDVLADAPAITVTDGHAAVHQAILGDRLRLPLDRELAAAVRPGSGPIAHPQLVCDLAIGQSTQVTQRVVANLFYRGLSFARVVRVGDTLRTVTTVEALRENTRKPDRRPTGLAVLHQRTSDQEGRTVLDFRRCAMLPLSPGAGPTGHDADVDRGPLTLDVGALRRFAAGWDLSAFRTASPDGVHGDGVAVGDRWATTAGDVVSGAPELARLTLNVAGAHHDLTVSGGRRLVYGGHVIGLGCAQLARLLPNVVTIVGWDRCDHLAPVHEGDTLHGDVEVTGRDALAAGGALVHLRIRMRAARDGAAAADGATPVLDWRVVTLMA